MKENREINIDTITESLLNDYHRSTFKMTPEELVSEFNFQSEILNKLNKEQAQSERNADYFGYESFIASENGDPGELHLNYQSFMHSAHELEEIRKKIYVANEIQSYVVEEIIKRNIRITLSPKEEVEETNVGKGTR